VTVLLYLEEGATYAKATCGVYSTLWTAIIDPYMMFSIVMIWVIDVDMMKKIIHSFCRRVIVLWIPSLWSDDAFCSIRFVQSIGEKVLHLHSFCYWKNPPVMMKRRRKGNLPLLFFSYCSMNSTSLFWMRKKSICILLYNLIMFWPGRECQPHCLNLSYTVHLMHDTCEEGEYILILSLTSYHSLIRPCWWPGMVILFSSWKWWVKKATLFYSSAEILLFLGILEYSISVTPYYLLLRKSITYLFLHHSPFILFYLLYMTTICIHYHCTPLMPMKQYSAYDYREEGKKKEKYLWNRKEEI